MFVRIGKRVQVVRAWVSPVVGIVVFAISMFGASPLLAQSEDEIKAAFLLNFARYVEWPESAFSSSDSPVQICTLDSDGFDTVVASTIEGKMIGLRSVEVAAVAGPEFAGGCHILFLGNGSRSGNEVVLALRKSSVFTVGMIKASRNRAESPTSIESEIESDSRSIPTLRRMQASRSAHACFA